MILASNTDRQRRLLAGLALVMLSACGADGGWAGLGTPAGSADGNIDAYPPMANNAPPGASAKALASAKAIGRGVNFGDMLEAPREGDLGLSVTDDFIAKAASAGFTSVRLPVRWSNHAAVTAPYKLDEAFLARVEAVVDALLAQGLYVVLDMHNYRQLDGDGLDTNEVAVADEVIDVRFVVLWEQLATRFRDRSDHLIFELYSEPHGRLNGEPWNVLAARALAAVRKTNPNRVVVVGPSHWNSATDLAVLKMPNDANLISTIHNYEPYAFTYQGVDWVRPVMATGVSCCDATQVAAIEAPLITARSWVDSSRYPVFVGEFGAYNKAAEASRIAYNRAFRTAAESRGMAWAYWEFASDFGVYDPVTLTFRQNLLDSLLAN